MKHLQSTDSMTNRNNIPLSFQKSPTIIILTALTLILLTLAPLYYPLIGYTIRAAVSVDRLPNSHSAAGSSADDIVIPTDDKCDIFSGEWVPDPKAPYYTNHTCWAIHEHQNCMKYGRPDTGFTKWKWRPDGCDLPVFNPFQFLEIVRGKSLAFIGDSVGRNQMQSLICLLSRAEYPIDVSYTSDEHFKRWQYTSYNFTLAYFWTPFLVNSRTTNTGLFNLYLDEPDDQWVPYASEFDYLILSSGHWFYRPAMYYVKRRLVGCRFCQVDNITDLPMYYGYRRAFRTAFRAINKLDDFKGLVILRTFAPSHFEGGEWNMGGDCVRTKPLNGGKVELEGPGLELYMTQMEEFRAAERDGKKKGLKYRVLDITGASLLRPDGHPSKYGHLASENVTMYNDCVHWCLPGPIDTWSDFLLEMLKREGKRSNEEKKKMLLFQEKKMKFM
ncbi:protein trichome birefringence-like 19 [Impatiens glandulifera]|uniref:protein trichome birefringence-like 19 n=1 Tax=Impatiens glandulifera TaxID=253017 RepID=UPI001FB0B57C|nr:protein trichome birefringence-like 19 [Impatiens glandulifera]